MRLALALVMCLPLCVPAGVVERTMPPLELRTAEVLSRVNQIIAEGNMTMIQLADGIVTQYDSANGDIVHVTELQNHTMRYEYACQANDIIYSYVVNSGASAASAEDVIILDTFDAAAYRETNQTVYELSLVSSKNVDS